MSKNQKPARNTGNPTCNWKPSEEELNRLREIGRHDPTVSHLIGKIVHYCMLLNGGSEYVDAEAWTGVRHIIDNALMRLAATPAKNEIELALKRDFLVGARPKIAAHRHLPKMALAALEEDAACLRPADPIYSLDWRS